MWKAPYRAKGEVSQRYNDGVVRIYSVEDTAAPGYAPVETPTHKITLRYEERRLGISRYFYGQQNQLQIDRVLRVQRAGKITSQDIAVTEDGQNYRVDLVQSVPDVWPESMDLTLSKIEQIIETETEGGSDGGGDAESGAGADA